jgi:hypothetical protein
MGRTTQIGVALGLMSSLACGGGGSAPPIVPPAPVSSAPVTAVAAPVAPVSGPKVATYSGSGMFQCGQGEDLVLENATIAVPGDDGVYTGGTCKLTLKNCHVSGKIGLEAAGYSEITVIGGTYEGTEMSVYATAYAHVHLQGVTLVGPKETSAEATIDEVGSGSPSSPSAGSFAGNGIVSGHADPGGVTEGGGRERCETTYTECITAAGVQHDACHCEQYSGEQQVQCDEYCEQSYQGLTADCELLYKGCK